MFAATQSAQAVTLQDLITAGTPVVSGNEVYTGFTSGGNLSASQVSVNFTSSGVQFTANWNTLTPGNDSSVISYTVSTAPTANLVFSGAGLDFAGQVILGNAKASVGETLTDPANPKTPYSMSVLYDGKGSADNNLTDSVTFNPSASSLRIVKSIDVAATGANAFASLNFVENTYTTAKGNSLPPPVPEPMTLALLPLALVGLGLRKKLAR